MHYLAASSSENPLIPTGPELIIGAICFIVVFGMLGKILLPRIQQTLAERTEKIEGGLARSEEAQAEATALLEQYRQQLAEARHEAARMREEAREQGAQIIAEMREQAQAEARRVTESAQAQIEAERQQALISLRAEGGTFLGWPGSGAPPVRQFLGGGPGGSPPRGQHSGDQHLTTGRSEKMTAV